MNKFRKYLAIVLCIGLITGCSDNKEEKKLTENISSEINLDEKDASAVCHVDYDYTNSNGFVSGSKFIIYADRNNIVTRIIGRQIAESNDQSVLDTFEQSLEENYSVSSQYGGYDYEINQKGNRLTVDTNIDYTVLDMEAMATDNEELKVYLNKDYKFTLDSVQSMYMAVGVECEEK